MFFYGQRGLGIGLGNNDNRPANRKQVVEPARDRYAGDVLAIGNQPDVRGQQKRFEIFVLDALDQSDVWKICFGLQLLQPIETYSPARKQEMNIRIIPQQSCGLKHDHGIVGKTEVAGKADHEACGVQATITVIGLNRPNCRSQRGPIRNEPDFFARYSPVAQKHLFGVAANGDDGIQRAKHQRICGADCVGHNRFGLQETGHYQDVGKKIMHDQRRSCAFQFGGGDNRIRQHKGGGNRERDVAALQFHQQRQKCP